MQHYQFHVVVQTHIYIQCCQAPFGLLDVRLHRWDCQAPQGYMIQLCIGTTHIYIFLHLCCFFLEIRLQHLMGMDTKGPQHRSGRTLPPPGDCSSRTTTCSGISKDVRILFSLNQLLKIFLLFFNTTLWFCCKGVNECVFLQFAYITCPSSY